MVAHATVLYPGDAQFDLKYYLSTHLPLCEKGWKELGLVDWKVIEYTPGPDGSKPYAIGALLSWESLESIGKAFEAEATKGILDDVKNFSDKSPLFLIGNVAGQA
ncbi:hypothetical protein LTR84_003274 [Exophiala bonariae]|uniref:EthD domain-containing protein n=1 Tax=Exophiala bonariae TaxID=1690606 RepID=A0AAV9N8G0_9EURO|nr:hypothetical protein LTR84_003274 [Exophiala bonariae]